MSTSVALYADSGLRHPGSAGIFGAMGWIQLWVIIAAIACSRQSPNASVSRPEPRVSELGSHRTGTLDARSGSDVPQSAALGNTLDRDPEPASVPADILALPRFYRALARLGQDQMSTVRIAWFGDSHTAADFMTGELRRNLQDQFGDGGPGFVHVAISNTRHDQIRTSASGTWKREPRSPTAYYEQEDGMFGLSGMRARAESGSALLRPHQRDTALNWELVVRPVKRRATIQLVGPGAEPRTADFRDGSDGQQRPPEVRARGSQLLGMSYKTTAGAELHVKVLGAEVFGAFGENPRGGVVLDTLGINGARARTMLAWHEGVWMGELAERAPSLVVLAYGSNEAGDGGTVESYAGDYRKIMDRVAAAVPEADCLLVGPTDRGEGQEGAAQRAAQIDALQRRVADELGCAYFSLFDEMGGLGGFRKWARSSPSLASSDGIHLTQEGYRRLGAVLSSRLFMSYRHTVSD